MRKGIDEKQDQDLEAQVLIQRNCLKFNKSIHCFNWIDNNTRADMKTLVLYLPDRECSLDIEKHFLDNLMLLEKKIVHFIKETARTC